ncbi:hypothetical protein PCANC_28953, partial [Puccinia coronata f. sp. avenae]
MFHSDKLSQKFKYAISKTSEEEYAAVSESDQSPRASPSPKHSKDSNEVATISKK